MFTFDGKHATQYFDKLIEVKRSMTAPKSARLKKIETKKGAYFFGTDTDVLQIEAEAVITGTDREDLWRKIRIANAWLVKDELKKLVLDDEPGLYFKAITTGGFSLDETIDIGFGTITFIVPDPDAYGEVQEQTVTSASAQFTRTSIRNREDGTQVTANLPAYKTGKYNQGVLMEEGTTNLLPSASSPTTETVTVTQGGNYYLSNVDGSTSIEHKRVETIASQQLSKAGTNVSITQTSDADFTAGSFTNTVGTTNQVQLTKQGTAFARTETTTADFADAGATRTNVTAASNEVALNTYAWEVIDDMSNWSANWATVNAGTSSAISQQSGFTRINVTSALGTNAGIGTGGSLPVYPTTVAARMKISGTCRAILQTTSNFIYAVLPTSASYAWYWIRFVNSTTVNVYVNGVSQTVTTGTGTTTNPLLAFFVPTGSTGTIDIDQVYIDYNFDKGAPPSTGDHTGQYISKGYSLASVVTAAEQSITWSHFLSSVDSTAAITVSSQIGTGSPTVTWPGTWTTETNGGSLASIAVGDSMANKSIRYKVDFTTKDPGGTVKFQDCTLNVDTAYNATGSFTSSGLNISAVNKAISSTVDWNWNANTTGSLSASIALSTDGGTNYSSFTSVTKGGSIPGITQTTDLSNARLKVKFDLSTTSELATPFLLDYTVTLTTGYLSSQTFTITAYNVGNIGISSGSSMSWSATTPASTGVAVEASTNGTTYTTVSTNGGSFLTTSENLTGKSLYIRYTLTTTDISITPTMNSITWLIKQAEPNRIKPATTTLVLTPVGVSRWQLENKQYGTGWQEYGTPRTAESMYIFTNGVLQASTGTIELFVNEEGENYGTRTIYENNDSGNLFSLIRTSTPEYIVKVNGTNQIIVAPPSVGWHHLAVTWNALSLKFYIDGVLVDSTTLGSSINLGATTRLYIGSNSAGTNQWNGLIDDLAIHTVEKDATYFLSRLTASASITDTSTVFPFDNSLTVLEDANITINGTAETYPTFTVTFASNASYFKVSNGIDYVQINHSFVAGDVLVINSDKQVVYKNGSSSVVMPDLDLDSDFFSIKTGQTITTEPDGIASVDIKFMERWL